MKSYPKTLLLLDLMIPPAARARKAIEILLGLKNKDDMPAQIMLPVELVIRESA